MSFTQDEEIGAIALGGRMYLKYTDGEVREFYSHFIDPKLLETAVNALLELTLEGCDTEDDVRNEWSDALAVVPMDDGQIRELRFADSDSKDFPHRVEIRVKSEHHDLTGIAEGTSPMVAAVFASLVVPSYMAYNQFVSTVFLGREPDDVDDEELVMADQMYIEFLHPELRDKSGVAQA